MSYAPVKVFIKKIEIELLRILEANPKASNNALSPLQTSALGVGLTVFELGFFSPTTTNDGIEPTFTFMVAPISASERKGSWEKRCAAKGSRSKIRLGYQTFWR